MYRAEQAAGRLEAASKLKRAAVYCRVSTDESLHLEFNSLHAQREACEAYIKSQQHEGWVLLPTIYDDGGYSGGSLERPALAKLLADIRAGYVDTIVVYKIDRLTRALSDFAKIVDVLDAAKASFVSVTQVFSTTTSMGRLTLNVLLSFAQFEREVGAERVRDKIAASKKKGMWMGGVCPLGYDAKECKLVVNEPEAESVRLIFDLYRRLGSVLLLEEELGRRGILSKQRVRSDGSTSGGCSFTRGALYALLQNRIYIGQTCHRGAAYPGQHRAIVDELSFEDAQKVLARNRVERRQRVTAAEVPILTGLVYDAKGRRMSPTHTKKGPVRYRYYSSRPGTEEPVRVAAAELEKVVLGQLAALLMDRRRVHDLVEPCALDAEALEAIVFAATATQTGLLSDNRDRKSELVRKLVRRVEVHPDQLCLIIKSRSLLDDACVPEETGCLSEDSNIVLPIRMVRHAREVRLAIPPGSSAGAPAKDPALIKLIARAWAARQALFNAGGASLREVATAQGCEPGYFTVLVKLGFLDPCLISDILEGAQPVALTRQRLARIRNLPVDWSQQRALLNLA